MTLSDKVNMGLISSTALVVIWVFTTFASAADVEKLEKVFDARLHAIELSAAYGQFYDRLDDFDEATVEENEPLAKEYARQMERIKAVICDEDADPEWERCSE